MEIEQNISLQQFNTFGIDVIATQFIQIRSVTALQKLLTLNEKELFILGGGSNLLLTKPVDKLVLKNEIKGIERIQEDEKSCLVAIGGGENWHETVLWAVQHDLGGIENLSLIPGTVGAAPIQNIGAYGVELKDVFVKLEAVHLQTGEMYEFDLRDCTFAYRMSVFKQKYKGLFYITKVYLRLTKSGHHRLNYAYGAIQKVLEAKAIQKPNIADISRAIIEIRSAKLPDPAVLGNSGSFFKNPIVSKTTFLALQKRFPHIVFYDLPNETVKIPAGWLIEQCGWKGKAVGNVACYKHQALVLVNLGNATGQEVKAHAERVMASVLDTFGIALSAEVNVF